MHPKGWLYETKVRSKGSDLCLAPDPRRKDKRLKLKYPAKRNHPLQAYITLGSKAVEGLS